jgi:hypothetical protein
MGSIYYFDCHTPDIDAAYQLYDYPIKMGSS